MKPKQFSMLRSYRAALRRHLKQGGATGLEAARDLGVCALSQSMETLDLARIHEEALETLVLPDEAERNSESLVRRAGAFFAEAITPIEETHRGAREANVQLKFIIETLTQRTVELAVANRELKQEISNRKAVEKSLRVSEMKTGQLLEKSRQMQGELRNLSRRLLTVQEEERKRISRELHDVIAQTLTGINLRLATLKAQSISNEKDLHRKIAVTQRLVEKSVEIVHRFARDLRPAVLDDIGIIPALRSYVKDFTVQTGIPVEVKAFAGVEKLDSVARTVLYRVVQEALANVVQHAQANRAVITIRKGSGSVCMLVTDNGKGFKMEDSVSAEQSNRLGLLGMRERVEMVGGTFAVNSVPGRETTVRVDIPLIEVGTPRGASGSAKTSTTKSP